MRYLLITVTLLALATGPTFAQHSAHAGRSAQTAAQRAEARTAHQTKTLNLTPAQATQVAALNTRFAQTAEGLQPTPTEKADRRVKHEKMKAERAAYEAELQKILTPEQLATYGQQRTDRQARHEERGARRKPLPAHEPMMPPAAK